MHFFDVFVKDDLLYGKIPLNEYDNCFRVGKYAFDCFLFLHIIISYRPSIVAVFLGDNTQKFKLKGCYIEKVL